MDIATVLTHILVVLAAAKVAAELAERLGIPAVVGEILAGILIGPSVLDLVGHGDEVLRTLGEIGVILLLLEVGMEMDLRELARVGRSSMLVATVGVVCPLVLGLAAMGAIGTDGNTALFVGAALTATSVGITARVFGDLRALATTEARTVLGAAVADDVMGLVVLTVVVRLVTEGSVSALSVAGIIALAIGFLVVGGAVGLRVTRPLFDLVERVSRSAGTMVALALAFTLAFARLADAARLAPIVGAFVAGIALTRSDQAPAIRRELAPVGHLFIPVFFLQIGIDAEIGAFGSGTVLRDAALLLVAAVVGKLLSPLGAVGSPGDKLLIGLGMLPRGEVGLIFATIGLREGVLDDQLYAALLLVVLVTTLGAPQLLKVRYAQLRGARARAPADAVPAEPEPPGGWLRVADGEVTLAARPPAPAGLAVALDAAVRVGRNRPGGDLLDWLTALAEAPVRWGADTVDRLFDVIERGNARSWRFLDTVGVLARALPELAEGIRARETPPFTLDPLESHRFTALEQLRLLDAGDPIAIESERVTHVERLLLAMLLAEGLEAHRDPAGAAAAIARRLGMDAEAVSDVAQLVRERGLLWAAAHRPAGLTEEAVVPLASHLDTPERARSLYVLTALRNASAERWELARLRELHDLIQSVLADDELAGVEARNLLARQRAAALALAGEDSEVRLRIADAPRPYLMRQDPATIARQAALLRRPVARGTVEVAVTPDRDCVWVDVAARDRHGLLAAATGALAELDLDVSHAVVATWPDGVALESYCVRPYGPAGVGGDGDARADVPDAAALRRTIEAAFGAELASPPLAEARVSFDHRASPWHTVCEVEAPDKPSLLHILATAFTAAGVEVVSASVTGHEGTAYDRFEVTGADGGKLDADAEATVVGFVTGGVSTRRRRFRGPVYAPAIDASAPTTTALEPAS